jgi:hypothetical protein
MPSSGSPNEHAEIVPKVVKSREGWELYIVTDDVMVGILILKCRNMKEYINTLKPELTF